MRLRMNLARAWAWHQAATATWAKWLRDVQGPRTTARASNLQYNNYNTKLRYHVQQSFAGASRADAGGAPMLCGRRVRCQVKLKLRRDCGWRRAAIHTSF